VFEKLSAKALDRRLATVGAVEIGAWAVEDVHRAFAAIDQDFIAGVALRTGKAIESFSDLNEKFAPDGIGERLRAIFGPSAGLIRDHQGGMGEAVLFRHLKDAGVDAQLALHPNNPSWDMLIEGHQVSVKTWTDVGNFSKLFHGRPDIPVVVPGDATGIPAHALHFDASTGDGMGAVHEALASHGDRLVLVDHSLSVEAIKGQVGQADTLITGGHGTFHGHLPIVTMALSGLREFDLLLTGKTDLATAAKNAALDVTGTGVGGAVGMKAGAGIGTIIWPGVGTVIGGLAGGIFGAMKGRGVTGDIKQRPFKEAVASYEDALSRFQADAEVYEAEASAEFNKAQIAQELQLRNQAHEARQRVEETKHALDTWVNYDSWLQPDEACEAITQSTNALMELRASIKCRYEAIPWWKKVLWPDVGTLAQQQALTFLRRIQRRLNDLSRMARKGGFVSRGQLMALLGAVGVMQEQAVADLEKIYAGQQERDEQARRLLSEALSAIVRQRLEAETQLKNKLEILRASIREAMQPALKNLNEQVERARLEGAKLGLRL
jgi:tetratricopeptide (TPR) repeat protein